MTSCAFDVDTFREPSDHGAETGCGGTDKRRSLRCAYTVDLVCLGGVDSGISKRRTLVFLEATYRVGSDWCQDTSHRDSIVGDKSVVNISHPNLYRLEMVFVLSGQLTIAEPALPFMLVTVGAPTPANWRADWPARVKKGCPFAPGVNLYA